MKTLQELSARAIVGAALCTVGMVGMGILVAMIGIRGLPPADHASAWWWLGGVVAGSVIAATACLIYGWWSGAHLVDTPETRAKHAAQVEQMRSLIPTITALNVFIVTVIDFSPYFYVVLGGVMVAFLGSMWVVLVFISTKPGRAMRGAGRREQPRPR